MPMTFHYAFSSKTPETIWNSFQGFHAAEINQEPVHLSNVGWCTKYLWTWITTMTFGTSDTWTTLQSTSTGLTENQNSQTEMKSREAQTDSSCS